MPSFARLRAPSSPRNRQSGKAFAARLCSMRKLLMAQLVLAGLIMTSCGTVTVRFVSNPQIPPSSTTGTIITVSLGSVTDIHGNPLTITIVSLVNTGLSSTLNFCSDQLDRFPIGSVVRVDFTPDTPCFILVNVFILG